MSADQAQLRERATYVSSQGRVFGRTRSWSSVLCGLVIPVPCLCGLAGAARPRGSPGSAWSRGLGAGAEPSRRRLAAGPPPSAGRTGARGPSRRPRSLLPWTRRHVALPMTEEGKRRARQRPGSQARRARRARAGGRTGGHTGAAAAQPPPRRARARSCATSGIPHTP